MTIDRPCLGLLLGLLSVAAAAEPVALRYGGQPMAFAEWETAPAADRAADLPVLDRDRARQVRDEGHGFVELEHDLELVIGPGREIEEHAREARLYLSAEGVHEYGNTSLWVDASRERIVIDQAYTLTPDGTRQYVAQDTVQMRVDADEAIFTDLFEVVIPFPGLVPGAIAVVEYRLLPRAERPDLPWSRFVLPQSDVPKEHFSLTVRWKPDTPAPAWHNGSEQVTCNASTAPPVIHCSASELPPYALDVDVAYRDVLPYLVFAEPAGWRDIYDRMVNHVTAALDDSGIVQTQLDRLLAGADSAHERLRRIHRFVAADIRYVGLESGAGGMIPRPSRLTLERRFGDCKDKTVLFIDLARLAGFEAVPVLNASRRYDPTRMQVPATGYFDHMVACVKLAADDLRCVDLTDPYTSIDTANADLQGTVQLGSDGVGRAPAAFPEQPYRWAVDNHVMTEFPGDGIAREITESFYTGAYGAYLRSELAPRTERERTDWLLDNFKQNVSDSVTPTLSLSGLDDLEAAVVLRSETDYPDSIKGDRVGLFTDVDSWLGAVVGGFGSANQHYPYRFEGVAYDSEINYRLPASQEMQFAGPELDFKSRFGTLKRHYRTTAGGLQVVTRLRMPAAAVPVAELADFNRFISLVAEHSRVWFQARMRGSGS